MVKHFFPEFTNGDEGLKEWLGDADKGVVHDTIFNPDRVAPNGRWGTVVYKTVTLPKEAIVPKEFEPKTGPKTGPKTLELAVYIGEAPMPRGDEPRPTFKINSVFPARGDGVTEVLPDGTIANKGFPSKN